MIKLGNRVFNPPWWATVLFLLVGTAMLLLGRWQLQRAAEKIHLATAAEQALSAPAVDIQGLLSVESTQALRIVSSAAGAAGAGASDAARSSAASADYQRVSATGTLLTEHQFLWDNRVHKGQAGFEVIIPLRLSGTNHIVLLNRGWIPVGMTRAELPDVSLPSFAADSLQAGAGNTDIETTANEITANEPTSATALATPSLVEGLLTEPSRGFAGGPALEQTDMTEIESSWPKLLQYFDYHAISASLGAPVVTGLIQHIANDAITVDGIAATELLKTDNWQPVANGPEKHYGYAFQWFGMFIALLAIYWFTNSRKVSQ